MKLRLRIENNNAHLLLLSIEPYPDRYDLPPGDVVEAYGDFEQERNGAITVQHFADCIVFYSRDDVVVELNGVILKPEKA